ncbi:MAG: YlbE family protein [Bacillota bacterium]
MNQVGDANSKALELIYDSDPVLINVAPAIKVVPNMTKNIILTSGAPIPWELYGDGQKKSIIGGAKFEGLATDEQDFEAKIAQGNIKVQPCHDYGCIGSLTGVTTASMPVFVVENRKTGNRAFCTLFEGPDKEARLNYGVYNEKVRKNLIFLNDVIARVIGEAVRISEGIPLSPIIRRALNFGDELHSRNTAASIIFTYELIPYLLQVFEKIPELVRETLDWLKQSESYFFLRLSMAASKATSDAAHGVEGSSIVTAMTMSSKEFAIRVSGLENRWFRTSLPKVEAKFFEGFCEDDIAYMGGESIINETMGLGGFAQAAAFPLQEYVCAIPEQMVERNLKMYEITAGEHPVYRIPYFKYRGVPTGIDIRKVVATGITPILDIGVANKLGGQIGAGVMHAPMACFKEAFTAFNEKYGTAVASAS